MDDDITCHIDLVIVGAGVAGLSAALHIDQQGQGKVRTIVLDGRERIGGRVCTQPLQPSGTIDDCGKQAFVDIGAAWLHGGIDGRNPLLPFLSLGGPLCPVRAPGESGALVARNPWTQAGADTLAVFAPSVASAYTQACSTARLLRVRAADVHIARSLLDVVKGQVGEQVRRLDDTQLQGMMARQLLRPALDTLVGDPSSQISQTVQSSINGLLHLLGAWNGKSAMDLPASECEGWGMDMGQDAGDGAQGDGADGDYTGAHALVGCVPCPTLFPGSPSSLCLSQVPHELARRANLRVQAKEEASGGTQTLQAGTICLSHAVTHIDWSHSEYVQLTVSTPTGIRSLRARHVILTAPVPCLANGSMTWQPPLPDEKVRAAKHLPHCLYKKVVLQFAHAWWPADLPAFWYISSPEEKATTQGQQEQEASGPQSMPWFHVVEDYWRLKGTPVLVGVLVGPEHVLSPDGTPWTDEACVRGLMHTLGQVLPLPVGEGRHDEEQDPGAAHAIPLPIAQAVSHWESDIYAGYGAYPAASPWTEDVHFDTLLRPLRQGSGPACIHFAGDGYSAQYLGAAHGAMISGKEAAQRVVDTHQCTVPNQTCSYAGHEDTTRHTKHPCRTA